MSPFPQLRRRARLQLVIVHYSLSRIRVLHADRGPSQVAEDVAGAQGAVRPGRVPLLRSSLLVLRRDRHSTRCTRCWSPQSSSKVYGSHTRVPEDPNEPSRLRERADGRRRGAPRDARRDRPIDIGYRGRPLPAYCGRGGQEKARSAAALRESSPALGPRPGHRARGGATGSTAMTGRASCRAAGACSASSRASPSSMSTIGSLEQYEDLARPGRHVTLDDLTEAADARGPDLLPDDQPPALRGRGDGLLSDPLRGPLLRA